MRKFFEKCRGIKVEFAARKLAENSKILVYTKLATL